MITLHNVEVKFHFYLLQSKIMVDFIRPTKISIDMCVSRDIP